VSTPFTVTIDLNRSVLPASTEITLYALVRITPTREAVDWVRNNPRRVHVVFTIDTSGSMAGEKLETAKQAIIRRFRKDLDSDDMISVVTFSNEARVVVSSIKKKDAADFERRIMSLSVEEETNLYDGLEKSIAEFKKTPAGYLKRIVLATDGVPTTGITDHDKIIDLARMAAQQGIKIDVYGIGDDYDYSLCSSIAKAAYGWMRHVSKADELDKVSQTTMDIYKGTIIDTLTMRILAEPGVKVSDVIMVYPQVKRLSPSGDVYVLGSLTGSPIMVAAKLDVGRFDPGMHKVASVAVGASSRDIVVNFVTDQSWVPEKCDARIYYMYGLRVSQMEENVSAGKPMDTIEKQLHDILSTDCAKQVAINDPYFRQIIARSMAAKTQIDARTKVDSYTNPMG